VAADRTFSEAGLMPKNAELLHGFEVSVTSHKFDRSKRRASITAGVTECWLVLAPEKQFETCRRPGRVPTSNGSSTGRATP